MKGWSRGGTGVKAGEIVRTRLLVTRGPCKGDPTFFSFPLFSRAALRVKLRSFVEPEEKDERLRVRLFIPDESMTSYRAGTSFSAGNNNPTDTCADPAIRSYRALCQMCAARLNVPLHNC